MKRQLVVSHMALLFFQWRHPAATEQGPDCGHDTHADPSRAPQNIKEAEPPSAAPSLSEYIHDLPHNRRRLFGSIGFTG